MSRVAIRTPQGLKGRYIRDRRSVAGTARRSLPSPLARLRDCMAPGLPSANSRQDWLKRASTLSCAAPAPLPAEHEGEHHCAAAARAAATGRGRLPRHAFRHFRNGALPVGRRWRWLALRWLTDCASRAPLRPAVQKEGAYAGLRASLRAPRRRCDPTPPREQDRRSRPPKA